MADDYEVPGVTAFVRGVQLSVLVLILVMLFEYGRSAAAGVAVLSRFGAGDVAAGVSILGLFAMLVLVIALCLPFYLSLHTVDVYVATGGTATSIAPGTLIPGGYAVVLFVLPGAVLAWAGYRRARTRGATTVVEHVLAGAAATIGYSLVAVLATVPGAWLFDAGVNALLSAADPGVGGPATVSLVYPNPVRAHLLVAVAYPLVFTVLGGLLAGVTADGPDRTPVDDDSPARER